MTKLRVLEQKKPTDHRKALAEHLRTFAQQVEDGEAPVPTCALVYVLCEGRTPQLYATGTNATPLGMLATADLCREAALYHVTSTMTGTGDD